MKSFSFSDLNRQSGEVLDAALAGPVKLTKRGKPKIVMMPVEVYEILAQGKSYRVADAPEPLKRLLEDALDDIAQGQ